jgi:hypothetical protein
VNPRILRNCNGRLDTNNYNSPITGAPAGTTDFYGSGAVQNTGSTSMPAFSGIAAGVGALASVGSSIYGATQSGSGGAALSLPPELEIQMLDDMQMDFDRMNMNFGKIESLTAAYDDRMQTVTDMINGVMPEADGIQALQDNTLAMATMFGDSVQELMDSGFITEDVQSELDNLRAMEGEDFTDPALEQDLAEQKRQLEQQMVRDGIGPAQRANALRQFEQGATESRFTRKQELLNNATQRGMARIGATLQARGQGVSEAMQMFGATVTGMNALFDQYGQGASALAGIAGGRLTAGQQGIETSQGIMSDRQNRYTSVGAFTLSDRAKDAVRGGLVGPGTFGQQTGVGLHNVEAYGHNVARRESGFGFNSGVQAGMDRIDEVNRSNAIAANRAGVSQNLSYTSQLASTMQSTAPSTGRLADKVQSGGAITGKGSQDMTEEEKRRLAAGRHQTTRSA